MVEAAGLIPQGTGNSIKRKESRTHKVDYYLDHVVEPGGDVYLPKLFKVMRESNVDNVVRLANDIQAAIGPGKYGILNLKSIYCVTRFERIHLSHTQQQDTFSYH